MVSDIDKSVGWGIQTELLKLQRYLGKLYVRFLAHLSFENPYFAGWKLGAGAGRRCWPALLFPKKLLRTGFS